MCKLSEFYFFHIFFSFIFISWRLITLQYFSGFLPYIDMNQPWIYMYSPSRPPLPPPSPPNPSGSSQCTRPEHLSHASSLGWWSVSHLIIYMFRCCSLETSHPHLLPWSPKVCSVHLCLFFCFAYRAVITIFLNHLLLKNNDIQLMLIIYESVICWDYARLFTSIIYSSQQTYKEVPFPIPFRTGH